MAANSAGSRENRDSSGGGTAHSRAMSTAGPHSYRREDTMLPPTFESFDGIATAMGVVKSGD